MEEQLNQAYEYIKAERNSEALALLEPLIRADRDNDDAWWLYANATDDEAAKRNALRNILRIGTSETREAKVRHMLNLLDDPFAIPEDMRQAHPPAKSTTKTSTKIFMGIGAVLGLAACVACFALVSFASKITYAPTNVDFRGSILVGESATGIIDTEGQWDSYTYEAEAGEILRVSVRTIDGNSTAFNDEIPPFIFLYGPDDLLITLSGPNNPEVTRLQERLPSAGEYTLVIRTLFGLGAREYTLSVTTR